MTKLIVGLLRFALYCAICFPLFRYVFDAPYWAACIGSYMQATLVNHHSTMVDGR